MGEGDGDCQLHLHPNAALGLIQKDAGQVSIFGKEGLNDDTKEEIGRQQIQHFIKRDSAGPGNLNRLRKMLLDFLLRAAAEIPETVRLLI